MIHRIEKIWRWLIFLSEETSTQWNVTSQFRKMGSERAPRFIFETKTYDCNLHTTSIESNRDTWQKTLLLRFRHSPLTVLPAPGPVWATWPLPSKWNIPPLSMRAHEHSTSAMFMYRFPLYFTCQNKSRTIEMHFMWFTWISCVWCKTLSGLCPAFDPHQRCCLLSTVPTLTSEASRSNGLTIFVNSTVPSVLT